MLDGVLAPRPAVEHNITAIPAAVGASDVVLDGVGDGRQRAVAVQVTDDGSPEPVPWKPSSVDWPDASVPFHAAFVNVHVLPLTVLCELHAFATVPFGSVTATFQPAIGWFAVTRTLVTKPPGHVLASV